MAKNENLIKLCHSYMKVTDVFTKEEMQDLKIRKILLMHNFKFFIDIDSPERDYIFSDDCIFDFYAWYNSPENNGIEKRHIRPDRLWKTIANNLVDSWFAEIKKTLNKLSKDSNANFELNLKMPNAYTLVARQEEALGKGKTFKQLLFDLSLEKANSYLQNQNIHEDSVLFNNFSKVNDAYTHKLKNYVETLELSAKQEEGNKETREKYKPDTKSSEVREKE